MELEEIEMMFKVNTEQMEKQFAKLQPMIDKFMGKTADSARAGSEKTADALNISKGMETIQKQLAAITERLGGSFEKMQSVASTGSSKIGQATSKMFSGSRTNVKRDLESMLADINAKMSQARAAQAKMRELMNQKSSLSMAQQSGTEGVKFDNQIASAQAQMTRYQNQAKALAQSMRGEFKAVPDSLKQIAAAMDQNEAKIETYRRQLKALEASYRDVKESMSSMGSSDRLAKQSTGLEKSIMSTRDKMNKLINSNDKLNESYAYVSDRGQELKSVVGKLNTELGESGVTASKSSGMLGRFGSSMKSAMAKMTGTGSNPSGWFNRIGNAAKSASSHILGFGRNSGSSMNRATAGAKRTSGAIGGIASQLKYLPAQLIVFGLLYQGIMQLSQGFVSALQTNKQFSSSLNQIKVNLLTAFYPIYNYVLPAINALMSALSKATSWIAQFSSALFGMSYSKARQGAKGLYEQTKAMNDTSKASSKAAASVKKANAEITKQNRAQAKAVREANAQIVAANKQGAAQVKAANAQIDAANKKSREEMEATKKKNQELMQSLMGFDELNVLDSSRDSSDSSYDKQPHETFTAQDKQTAPEGQELQSADGVGTGANDDGLDFNTPMNAMNSVTAAAKRLQKILGELFDPMKEAWDAKGQTVADAAKYAWREVKRALEDVGRSFLHVWDNGTGKKTVEAILQLLADMLNIIGDIAKAFSQAWEGGGGRGTRLIQVIFNSLNDVLKLIHDIATSFREAWNGGNLGERIFANLITLVTNVVRIIGDIAKAFDNAWRHGNTGTKLIQSILNALNAVIKVLDNIAVAFRNAWNSGAGERIASNLYKIFTNIFNTISALGGQFDKAWKHGNVGTSIFKTLLGMINDMLGALNDMAGATVKWASKLDFTPLLESINGLLKAIRPVVKDVWDGLDWGYKNLLLPLAKYTITSLIPDFFDLLAAALKVIHSIIKAATPAFEWFYKDFILPISKIAAIALSGALKALTGALKLLSDWIDKHQKAVEAITKVLIALFTIKIAGSMIAKMKDFTDTLSITAMLKFDKLKAGAKYADDMLGVVIEFAKHPIVNIKEMARLKFDNLKNGWSNAKKLWDQASKGWQNSNLAKTDFLKPLKTSVASKEPMKLGQKLGTGLSVGLIAVTSAVDIYKGIQAKNPTKKAESIGSGIGGAIGGGIGLWFGGPLGAAIGQQIGSLLGKWGGNGAVKFGSGWNKYGKGKRPSDWLGQVGFDAHGMLKGVTDWTKNIGSSISTNISNTKKTFQAAGTNIGKWTSGFITGTKKTVNKWASEIGKNVHTKVADGKELAKTAGKNIGKWTSAFTDKTNGAIKGIKAWASGIGGNIKSKVSDGKRAAQKAGTSIGGWVNDFRSKSSKTLSSWAGALGSKANSGINGAKSLAKNAGSKLGGWVSDFRSGTAKTLSNWAGGLGGKIGKGLSSGWRAVKAGAASIANGIVSTIGKAVNGVIDGIKWILSHVGASGKANAMSHWTVPKFSRGGRHKGGPALVNDQPGSVYQEAYKLPNGKTGLFPKVRDLMVNLPQNTQIMNATQVARRMVPHYANGIGDFDFDLSGLSNLKIDIPDISFDFGSLGDFGNFNFGNFNFGNLFDGIGSAVGGFVDSAGDAMESLFDDFKHPERLLKSAMKKFVKFTGLGGYPLDIAKSMVDFSVDNTKSFISGILKKYSTEAGDGLNNPGGSSVNRWRSYVRKGLAANGLSTSPAMIAKVLRQIQTESGGNPLARQPGADPDGDGSGPALGLMQTKRMTFNANAFSGHKNIFNGYDSILAGLHYAKARYGSALGFLGQGHGYANGGLGNQEGLYPLFEGNKAEMVLPLTNVPRSMQLIQQALSFMGQTFGDGLQMPTALTQQADLSSLGSMPSSTNTQNISGGGVNNLGPTIVNALLQGLQMANVTGNSNGTQPIDVHLTLQVGNEKFGEAAVKGINAVNQRNGKNMLRL